MGYHLAQVQTAILTVSCSFQRTRRVTPASRGTKMIDEDRSEEISSDERRQYDRSRVIVDVSFNGGDANRGGCPKEIGTGGFYMKTQADIPVGARLTLRVPLAGEHALVKSEVG